MFFLTYLDFKEKAQNINGKIMINLTEEEMKKLGMNLGQRKKLIRYINQLKQNEINSDKINITRESSEEEISKFLKEKLNFDQEIIDDLELDGEALFELEDEEIDEIDLTNDQKERLKRFLKENKNINKKQEDNINQSNKNIFEDDEMKITVKSSKYEVSRFLKEKLSFTQEIIDEMDLDGETLFDLSDDEINELYFLDKEQKENLKNLIKENNNKNKTQYKIQQLNDKSKYNIFLILPIKKNYYNKISFTFKIRNPFNNTKEKICDYRILNVSENDEKIPCELFLIQISIDNLNDDLYLNIKNDINKGYEKRISISIHKCNENFFSFYDFFDFSLPEIVDVSKNTIFNEYYKFFFYKQLKYEEKYKKEMLESLRNEKKIVLSGNNILFLLKICFKYNLKFNINKFNFNVKINDYINKENLLSNEINNSYINLEISKLILHIYIIQLRKNNVLFELISKSKHRQKFCKALFELLKDKMIKPKNLFFFKDENCKKIQLLLLDEVSKKSELNYIIEISQNLYDALEFIKINSTKINEKVNSLASYFDFDSFKINLNNLEINDNLENILALVNELFNIENDEKLIDYEQLFICLDNKFYTKELRTYSLLNNYINPKIKNLNPQLNVDMEIQK